jgi:tetratricopeptide (TPR) repeat protein
VRGRDVATMERLTQTPEVAVAASSLAGVLLVPTDNKERARVLLDWVFSTGKDPAADPFIAQYARASVTLTVVAGVTTTLPLDRDCVGLVLAELEQHRGDLARATSVIEQLQPTTVTALSLAELYALQQQWDDVIDVTNAVTNADDATSMLCTFRGVALRERRLFDAARLAFKEALKSKRRNPVVRHHALLERARCYEAEGKRAMARKDLERIMAEDASYPGLQRALDALRGEERPRS